jgi:hypothetical protein
LSQTLLEPRTAKYSNALPLCDVLPCKANLEFSDFPSKFAIRLPIQPVTFESVLAPSQIDAACCIGKGHLFGLPIERGVLGNMKTATWKKTVHACLCLAGLAMAASTTGCQVTVGGQTLPSPYYLDDDIQYFPAGPEFKLSREAAELEAAKAESRSTYRR